MKNLINPAPIDPNLHAKASKIAEQLNEIYPSPPIPLNHHDSFTLLIAVMFSAQTTDRQVNIVTPALFERAPNPAAMAQLSVEEILSYIRSIGFSSTKAKNAKAIAEIIERKHHGQVPDNFEDLEALPGVGHKTASVVMSQAFGIAAFPIDTHIFRLSHRWGLSAGKTVEKVEIDLKRLFPEQKWNKLHLQMIYFGREYCPALRHDSAACPICRWAA